MPELPDVETYRRHVEATSLNRQIIDVVVHDERLLDGVSPQGLLQRLAQRMLVGSRRHGKHLLLELDDGTWLECHFGMSGRLRHVAAGAEDPAHDRVRLDFADGSHLAIISRRLLGHVRVVSDAEAFLAGEQLGPDPLADGLDEGAFTDLLRAKSGTIKSALMDQGTLAGIGNVYSDEILFQAGIHPKRSAGALSDEEFGRLYREMRRVLETAIDQGAGWEDFPDRAPEDFLLARRHKGGTCPACGGPVEAIKISSRTAWFCPACQR
ncbi:MAG: DNA-formamidopyrimidine glycosylase [Alphaproteobacteria bacterium]|jgi:formamidopyrimidine-DNA glycosylase|nr:DNA-formamidopyrimidine glycosylase [Alphaproteobacteria bacterium]